MECIKYHFKSDDMYFKDSNNQVVKNKAGFPVVDIPLMNDILVNSKGLRFYSKFGFCYKEEMLNYDKKLNDSEIDLEENFDSDNEVELGKLKESSTINPFTKQPAKEGESKTYIGLPHKIKHNCKSDLFEPMKPKIRGLNHLFECDSRLDAKEISIGLSMNRFSAILTYEAHEKFVENGNSFFIEEKELADILKNDLAKY